MLPGNIIYVSDKTMLELLRHVPCAQKFKMVAFKYITVVLLISKWHSLQTIFQFPEIHNVMFLCFLLAVCGVATGVLF